MNLLLVPCNSLDHKISEKPLFSCLHLSNEAHKINNQNDCQFHKQHASRRSVQRMDELGFVPLRRGKEKQTHKLKLVRETCLSFSVKHGQSLFYCTIEHEKAQNMIFGKKGVHKCGGIFGSRTERVAHHKRRRNRFLPFQRAIWRTSRGVIAKHVQRLVPTISSKICFWGKIRHIWDQNSYILHRRVVQPFMEMRSNFEPTNNVAGV